MRSIKGTSLGLSCGLPLALPAAAQPIEETLDFKKLMERGEYKALGRKLAKYLDLEKADPKLRRYLEMNLEYLARGAKPAVPGSEIILVRGAKNDMLYNMPAASGGEKLMLPNSIRHMRTSWDKRLPRITRYFSEATTATGGNGKTVHDLERIIEHHKGGGLGTSANSVKSVLISASTNPISSFGPPFYILKVAPERAIFNWKGLSGEKEVLLPFWILPHEIVAKCNSMEEVRNHPLYQQSKFKNVNVSSYGYGAGGSANNWAIIEQNIREGRAPLEGVAGLNSYFSEGPNVGPRADAAFLQRFTEKVERLGGVVERVHPGDHRLPPGAQARTYLDAQGRPHVLIPADRMPAKVGLIDELTHVHQLAQMLKSQGRAAVQDLLMKARMGDPKAKDVVNRWEMRAKRMVRSLLPQGDPLRPLLDRSIAELQKEIDPYSKARRATNGTIDWKQVGKQFGGGLAHFTLALFLKELALVARTGDSMLIEEFFQGLLTTDFYVHYGLFSLGAAGADMAYTAFVQRHVNRFIRPRFVQSVLRSQLSLAVGMALPDLVMGKFDGRVFAINLAGLGLSSVAVKAGVAGIKWVASLARVPGASAFVTKLAQARRLTKVSGFLYHAVETAVVLYVGEKISRAIDAKLRKDAAEDAVREAAAALIADPKGEGAQERAAALSEAFRNYRDMTAGPMIEAEQLLMERLERLATEVKQNDDALKKLRESDLPNLRERGERLARQREEAFQRDTKRAIDAYDAAFAAAREKVYDPSVRASELPSGEDITAVLRGRPEVAGEDTTSWRARQRLDHAERRVLNSLSDLPNSRLAAYDQEAAFWDAMAKAHSDDPLAAAYFQERGDTIRAVRQQDHDVVSGKRTGDERTAEDVDQTLQGFLKALEDVEKETSGAGAQDGAQD